MRKMNVAFAIAVLFVYYNVNAQVGIGITTPDASSMLDLKLTRSMIL